MAVCSCTRKAKESEKKNTCRIESEVLGQEIIDKLQSSEYSEYHVRTITDFISTVAINPQSYYSGSQFLLILRNAIKGDYSLLQSLCRDGDIPSRKKVIKFNSKNFSCLMNKKMRKCPIKKRVYVPLFGGNSRYLESHEKIGKKFSKIGVKFNSIIVIDGIETRVMMNNNKTQTVLKVWCHNDIDYDRLQNKLIKIGKEIQEAHQQVARPKRISRPVLVDFSSNGKTAKTGNITSAFNLSDLKSSLSDVFSQKYLMKKKDGKRRMKPNDYDILKNGHCLYCMIPYTGLHQQQTDHCQYHPGYQVKVSEYSEWTCCKNRVEAGRNNGCTVGQHAWRPHKKASRKKHSFNIVD
ncbi:hypothetical protein LOTGIDRAFT_235376 [Lottia gigantea]|uniref:Uncharacterized protein n=1 Tax=Lottia gigantea TaxID=225164 RepID=V3ZQG9_LOTGI|nr:hypothetical protein LOTGIDRAFT_235376 [Lottia gigantea]ESO86587.1 hypothetical protein LOTGIDRAFT_235376 [Lottia gigantea]